jgi:WD40 repeat protein
MNQEALGNPYQDMSNVVSNVTFGDGVNTFNFSPTQVIQYVSVDEIKTRTLNQTSPYKGLKKFEPGDSEHFFGRDQLILSLMQDVTQSNLILLLGASGSGKSSVIQAGLIPRLRKSLGTKFTELIFKPDRDPFISLFSALLTKGRSQTEAGLALASEVNTLSQVVTTLKREEEYWFIYIDQFEELFTISEPGKRDRFIESLTRLYQTLHESQIRSVKIVMTMRADFLDRFSPYADLGRITHGNMRLITDMHRDELWLAIEQPAAQHGVVFEEGLVEEIIKDVQGQAGFLPLLQYTLELLWRNDDVSDRTLNKSTYRNLGGVRGALQKRVEQVFNSLSADEQAAAKNIFLNLVNVTGVGDADTFGRAVSKRAYRSQFTDFIAISTLTRLVNENLLVSDDKDQSKQSTVEIAHEALLSSWDTLKQWIEEAKDVLAIKSRLAEDMAQWKDLLQKDKDRANEELLTGSRLERILELRDEGIFELRSIPLNLEENQFIDASVDWRDRIVREQQEQLIKLERALTEATLREQSARVRHLASFQPVDSLLLAIQLTGKNLEKIPEQLLNQVSEGLQNSMNEACVPYRTHRWGRSVWSVAFSPDGQIIVGARDDNVLRLSDLRGNLIGNYFEGHQMPVYSVAFSPDGKMIVSGSADDTILLWDLEGNPIGDPFQGHEGTVSSVAFSPNGQIIVSGSNDRTIRLWDLQGNLIEKPFQGHEDAVSSVAFSPNGQIIVSGSNDRTIRLWDLQGNLIEEPFQGHEDAVSSVAFSPNGQIIVSGSHDRTVRLWDLQGNLIEEPFQGHEKITSVAFGPNGQTIAVGSRSITIYLWNFQEKSVRQLSKDDKKLSEGDREDIFVNSVAFSPNGEILVTGENHSMCLWRDLRGDLVGQPLRGHEDAVSSVAFSPNGQIIVSGSHDRTVRLWDLQGNLIEKPFQGHEDAVSSVAFSPNGQIIASGSRDCTVRLWDLQGNLIGQPFQGHERAITSVAFSPNGQIIASGSHDCTVRLWDLQGNLIGQPFQEDKHHVNSVEFSPDGKVIAIGCSTSTVHLRDLQGNSIGTSFSIYRNLVISFSFYSVAFSPDGQTLVSGNVDGTVRLWDLQGKPVGLTFQGHESGVPSVNFSPDGQIIVSGSKDGTVRLWDRQGNPIGQTFRGHEDEVWSVDFSPDGQIIVSGSKDGTIRLWRAGWRTRLQVCCDRLRHHSIFSNPKKGSIEAAAYQTCQLHAWNALADELTQQGLAKIKERDFKVAIEILNQAIEFNPDHIEAYHNRAVAYIQKADYQNAVQDCDRAIGLIQNCSVALISALLVTLKQLKRFTRRGFHDSTSDRASDLALVLLFLFSKPNYADLHYKRGGCRLKLGDKQSAKADWQKAADLYRKQGQLAKTEKILEYLRKIH